MRACLPPFVKLPTAQDKLVQQATDAFWRQSLQVGIAARPFVGPVFPLDLTNMPAAIASWTKSMAARGLLDIACPNFC
jgi:hypothetical protein